MNLKHCDHFYLSIDNITVAVFEINTNKNLSISFLYNLMKQYCLYNYTDTFLPDNWSLRYSFDSPRNPSEKLLVQKLVFNEQKKYI